MSDSPSSESPGPSAEGAGPRPPDDDPRGTNYPASPEDQPSSGSGSLPVEPSAVSVSIPAEWAASSNRPEIPPIGRRISYPQLDPEDIPAASPIPSMVPNPFDPSTAIDLAAAPVPNFNLVDGTVAIATDPQMPFVLFKGHNPNTWFYAPRWGRLAKNPDGEPAFMVTKKVRNNPDGSKTTLGGILSFMVELVVELPSQAQRQQWTNLIKTLYNLNPTGGAFNFQPARLSPGKMDIFGLDSYARPGQQLKGIDVGSSSSIAFAIELTPDGADHFAAMLGASPSPYPPQVSIMFTFRYQYLIPQCQIKARGYKKKAYDYFSWNARARASYFGLVNGSVDYQSVRADLRQQQALDVSIIGEPPKGVDLARLLDAIFDQMVKLEVGQWIQPDPKPVTASAPGGFFGGVSVAMKSVSLSDTAQFDQTLNFTGVGENIHQVSFNFEQQLGAFDKRKHLFIEEDDIKLPFKVLISSNPLVKRIVPSASYTTPTGPRMVQCSAVSSEGGESSGTIQFAWPSKPASAQLELLVDFQDPYVGYKYKQTLPISDTGAAFAYYPTQFVQRSQLMFPGAAYVADPNSKALLSWEWTPPVREGTAPRPKVAGHVLISVDPNNPYNLPTYDVVFPFHPDDWTGESTPSILYKFQGLTGDWRGKSAAGKFSIGATAVLVDFEGVSSIGEPSIPTELAHKALLDPAYRQRLTATYGTPPPMTGPIPAMSGSTPTAPGGGFAAPGQPGQPGQPPPPGQPLTDPASRPLYPLGFKPDQDNGELSLYGRELKARASYARAKGPEMAAGASPAFAAPSAFDFRDVNGYNYLTPVKAQGNCGSCVAFGTTAAVEGAIRRYHPEKNPDLSEAHLFFCHARQDGRTCGNYGEINGGWYPNSALTWWRDVGVADEGCFPYAAPATTAHPTPSCTKCWDSDSRLTRIDELYSLTDVQKMKWWMATGFSPLVAGFTVYQDFYDFFQVNTQPSAVYRVSATPGTHWGGHCVCVIGYNDSEQAWICKNSWGPHWAASGFFKIGYGEAGIDYQMFGVGVH